MAVRPRWAALALAAVLVALGVPTVSPASSLSSAPVWRSSDVVTHHFVRTFVLDAGVVTVTPDLTLTEPTVAMTSAYDNAVRKVWATSQLANFAPAGVGLGDVTIRLRVAGVPVVTHEKALVGVAYFDYSRLQCTMYQGHPVVPRWSGWAVTVLGISARSPAVTYVAHSLVCGRYHAATLNNATEALSVPWRLQGSGPTIVARVPFCSNQQGLTESGSTSATLSVLDFRFDDVALRDCGAAHPASIAPGFNFAPPTRFTRHGALGPVRQVTSEHLG